VRVGINLEQLLFRTPGGVGRYTARLATLLPGLFPEDHYYYADGIRLGDLTSNGGDPGENTYVQALAQRNQVQSPNATGPFRWGAFQGGTDGNFGQGGYSHINPLGQGTAWTASQYAVRDGDTLQSMRSPFRRRMPDPNLP